MFTPHNNILLHIKQQSLSTVDVLPSLVNARNQNSNNGKENFNFQIEEADT